MPDAERGSACPTNAGGSDDATWSLALSLDGGSCSSGRITQMSSPKPRFDMKAIQFPSLHRVGKAPAETRTHEHRRGPDRDSGNGVGDDKRPEEPRPLAGWDRVWPGEPGIRVGRLEKAVEHRMNASM